MLRIKSGVIVLFCLASITLHAQSTIPASAGNASGSGGTVAYPATDFITLRIKNYEIQYLSYKLYDINGTILRNSTIDNTEIIISMQNLKASIYFLKVIHGLKDIKTFKIIKK
jgi:hypothetical protein